MGPPPNRLGIPSTIWIHCRTLVGTLAWLRNSERSFYNSISMSRNICLQLQPNIQLKSLSLHKKRVQHRWLLIKVGQHSWFIHHLQSMLRWFQGNVVMQNCLQCVGVDQQLRLRHKLCDHAIDIWRSAGGTRREPFLVRSFKFTCLFSLFFAFSTADSSIFDFVSS